MKLKILIISIIIAIFLIKTTLSFTVSSSPSIVDVNNQVTFTIKHNYTTPFSLYICGSSRIHPSGCLEEILTENRNIITNPISANYIAKDSDSTVKYYFVGICQEICEISERLSFNVNHKPIVNSVEIIPYNSQAFYDNTNLKCNVIVSDQDGNQVTVKYEWFTNNTGVLEKRFETYNQSLLSHVQTQRNDKWICAATPYDGRLYGDKKYSEQIIIDPTPSAPFLISLKDNSNNNKPVQVGELVKFNIKWQDLNSNVFNIYVCDNSGFVDSGCLGKAFASSLNYYDNNDEKQANLSYIIQENDADVTEYFVAVCDSTNICSTRLYDYFYKIVPPKINSIFITQEPYLDNKNLNCIVEYDLNDSYNNPTVISYEWYYKDSGQDFKKAFANSAILASGNTLAGQQWYCKATPYTILTSGKSKSSDIITILPSHQIFVNISNITIRKNHSYHTIISYVSQKPVIAYVCSSPNIVESGCLDYEYARAGFTTTNPIEVEFEDNQQEYCFIRVCDSDFRCSDNYFVDLHNIKNSTVNNTYPNVTNTTNNTNTTTNNTNSTTTRPTGSGTGSGGGDIIFYPTHPEYRTMESIDNDKKEPEKNTSTLESTMMTEQNSVAETTYSVEEPSFEAITGSVVTEMKIQYKKPLLFFIILVTIFLVISLIHSNHEDYENIPEKSPKKNKQRDEQKKEKNEKEIVLNQEPDHPKMFSQFQRNSYFLHKMSVQKYKLVFDYIEDGLRKGRNPQKILNELKSVGWPSYLVNEVLEKVKKKIFIENSQMLRQGMSEILQNG